MLMCFLFGRRKGAGLDHKAVHVPQVSPERTSFKNDLIPFFPTCTNLALSPEYEEVATGTKQKAFVNIVDVERFCCSALALDGRH